MRRDGGNSGGDAQADVAEPAQFIHSGVDLLCARALRVEDGFSIVKDYEHLLRG